MLDYLTKERGCMFAEIIASISSNFYTYVVIVLLIVGGIYFSVRTKAVQVRTLKDQVKVVTEKPKDKKGVSSFHALMVSTASRVGTGNIVGVALALCLGGFGSIFWMWVFQNSRNFSKVFHLFPKKKNLNHNFRVLIFKD